MKHIVFYFDFVRPEAYLAFETLPQILIGHSCCISYQPVSWSAICQHHGCQQLPENSSQQQWRRRFILWYAQQQRIPLQWPLHYPFDSQDLLQLALVASHQGRPGRYVCESIFHHLWRCRHDAGDFAQLKQQLAPIEAKDAAAASSQLVSKTCQALADGVFDLPSLVVDGQLFCGLQALPMLKDYLDRKSGLDGGLAATAGQPG